MIDSTMRQRPGDTGAAIAAGGAASLRPWIAIGLLLLTHALLAWFARDTGITTRQDDANYVILAQSLRGFGYNDAYRPDAPVHNMYPPGYPALLALWGWPFGDAFDWLVLLNIGLSVATLGLAFAALQRIVAPWLAALTIMPLAVNPGLVSFAGSVATETPYAFFAMLALTLLASPETAAKRWGWACAAAVVAALTRSIGVTLLAALALHFALDRKWKALAVLSIASALTVGGWLLWTTLSPEQYVGRSYVADAMATVRRAEDGLGVSLVRRTVRRIPIYFGQNVPWAMGMPTIPGTPIDNLVASGALLVGSVGGIVLFFRRWRSAALYLVAYLGLLMIWTWAADRFVVPVLPLLVPAVILGLAWIFGLRWRWAGIAAAAAAALVLTAGAATRTLALVGDGLDCARGGELPSGPCLRRDQASYFAALHYIREATPEDAIILTAKPEPLHLYTGRRSPSIRRALSLPPEEFLRYLRAEGTSYILLGSLQGAETRRLPEAMLPHCETLAVESFFPARTWLFRLRGDGEPRDREACDAIVRSMELNRERDFSRDP